MRTAVKPAGAQPLSPAPRRRRRMSFAAAALSMIVAGAGVTALVVRGDDPSRADRLDAGTGRAAAPMTDEERVEEAIRGFFRVDAEALAVPDPNHPLFSTYLAEPQLSASVQVVRTLADRGLAARPIPNSVAERRITVGEVSGGRATAEICSVDDGQVVNARTGVPAFDYPPGQASTVLFSADLVDEFGSWKITTLTQMERWEGVAGCAVGRR